MSAALILSAARDAEERDVMGAQLREVLGLPTDRRGVVLACGSAALGGLAVVLLASGEATGIAYLLAAIANYLFLHRRLLPSAVWIAVAGGGLLAVLAGSPAAVVQVLLAGLLALVAAWPPPIAAAAPVGATALVVPGPMPVAAPPSLSEPVGAPAPVLVSSPAPHMAPNGNSLDVAAVDGRLTIHTIGGLRLTVDGKELASGLERKPTLAFIWNYLLARELACMRPISRPDLAEEVSPTLPAKSRAGRLRKQLWDLENDLPPALTSAVRDTGHVVSLDLSGAWLDFAELKALATEVRSSEALLAAEVRTRAESFLGSLSAGGLLPRFEEFETAVSGGHGVAGSLIGALRQDVLTWRGDVSDALAEHYIAAGEASRAAALLAPMLELDPSREDIARHLLAAYIKTGQSARASELRRTFNLNQEV